MKRMISILCALLICFSMTCFSVSAAVDPQDGYLEIVDANGDWFGGYYEPSTAFEYHLKLYLFDEDLGDYALAPIDPQASVSVSYYDDQNEVNTASITTGTGDSVAWTVSQTGEICVHVELTQNGYTYDGIEYYWIGKPIDIRNCSLQYMGPAGYDGFLYTGKSIKKDIHVYDFLRDRQMVEGVDYTLFLTNDGKVGDGKVTVVGAGDYSGTITEEYIIIDHTQKFIDIKRNGWYVGAVNFCLDMGLFAGTGKNTFSPDAPVTRGMFVTVIGRLLGWDELPDVSAPFVDVRDGMYYTKYVAYAKALNIVAGITQDRFCPDDRITREQMCALIVRTNNYLKDIFSEMESEGEDLSIDLTMKEGGDRFADHNKISSYARSAVYACRNEGIVSGKGGNTFDPKGNATRAEMAMILLQYTTYLGTKMMQ